MPVLTREQIIRAENAHVNGGEISFRNLMLNAGVLAAKKISSIYHISSKKIAVICGIGNNGGDGYVLADYLKRHGASVTVFAPLGLPVTDDARFYSQNFDLAIETEFFGEFDIIVDAIFGVGFKGELSNDIVELITKINASHSQIISIDIPSGVECDTGAVKSVAVNADATISFIALKPCFVVPSCRDYCGKIHIIDIGVPITEKTYDIIEKPNFSVRKYNSHKGTYGTAMMICGSYGMAGAAMLSAKAALRNGLGLARCVVPKSIYSSLSCYLPEAVCHPMEETESGTIKYNPQKLSEFLEKSTAVLFGCGSGHHIDNAKILKFIIENSDIPIIIDADGINCLSQNIELLSKAKAPVILTPHPGEFARLCGTTVEDIENNRTSYATKIAEKYGCIVVLKGCNTLVCDRDGNISFNIIGNSGMATGGTGDVLAGIIVSFLAQGLSPINAAKNGVYVHSAAADIAIRKKSQHALLPSDIIEEL